MPKEIESYDETTDEDLSKTRGRLCQLGIIQKHYLEHVTPSRFNRAIVYDFYQSEPMELDIMVDLLSTLDSQDELELYRLVYKSNLVYMKQEQGISTPEAKKIMMDETCEVRE